MSANRNPLYPVFLKLHELSVLVVGGGEAGSEKLRFIMKSSPQAHVTVVATWFADEVLQIAQQHPTVKLLKRPFLNGDVQGKDLIIAATNLRHLNQHIRQTAKKANLLVNVADTPDLCDFYLGSIVTRGPLKVAISTNGQSPTFAKRFRQWLEATLPENVDEAIEQLKAYRDTLANNDFKQKIEKLNQVTESLLK